MRCDASFIPILRGRNLLVVRIFPQLALPNQPICLFSFFLEHGMPCCDKIFLKICQYALPKNLPWSLSSAIFRYSMSTWKLKIWPIRARRWWYNVLRNARIESCILILSTIHNISPLIPLIFCALQCRWSDSSL